MFIRQLQTWNEIVRYNEVDGDMLSQYNQNPTNKMGDFDFQEWVNCFKLKLSDKSNISTTTTGSNGIMLDSSSETYLNWKGIYDYSGNLAHG